MRREIKEVIKEFEEVQESLRDFGAGDTEPDWVFHNVIRCAVQGKDFPANEPEYWELFETEEGWTEAARMMTTAAEKVYNFVREEAKIADIEYLRSYCWRVDF